VGRHRNVIAKAGQRGKGEKEFAALSGLKKKAVEGLRGKKKGRQGGKRKITRTDKKKEKAGMAFQDLSTNVEELCLSPASKDGKHRVRDTFRSGAPALLKRCGWSPVCSSGGGGEKKE